MWMVYSILGLVVVSVLFSVSFDRYRRYTFSSLASRLGYTYEESPVHPSDIDRFFDGGPQTVRFLIASRNEDVRCGDVSTLEHRQSGRSTLWSEQRASFCLFRLPCDLPSMHIRREGIMDDIVDMVHDDIDLHYWGKFSEAFHVDSTDEAFARRFLTMNATLIPMLLAKKRPPALSFKGHLLNIGQDGDLWTPKEFEVNVAFGKHLVGIVDEYCETLTAVQVVDENKDLTTKNDEA